MFRKCDVSISLLAVFCSLVSNFNDVSGDHGPAPQPYYFPGTPYIYYQPQPNYVLYNSEYKIPQQRRLLTAEPVPETVFNAWKKNHELPPVYCQYNPPPSSQQHGHGQHEEAPPPPPPPMSFNDRYAATVRDTKRVHLDRRTPAGESSIHTRTAQESGRGMKKVKGEPKPVGWYPDPHGYPDQQGYPDQHGYPDQQEYPPQPAPKPEYTATGTMAET